MALGPQAPRKSREAILKSAERIIDRQIREDTRGEVTIATSLLPERFDSRDWETELRPKYIAAGWKQAKWVSDQRDGDYIHFVS